MNQESGVINTVSEQSKPYTSNLPEHIHYVPYDLLTNPKSAQPYEEIPANHVSVKVLQSQTSCEYAEIEANEALSGGYAALRTSQMLENEKEEPRDNKVPQEDVSYAIPNKMVTNVAYQSLDECPRENYDNVDNTYLELEDDGEHVKHKQSVKIMVDNDIYNK